LEEGGGTVTGAGFVLCFLGEIPEQTGFALTAETFPE
jgi:hypothetical protein